jgi:hypothetical protein
MADWNREQIDKVLRWFAGQEQADLFLNVIVSAPNWRDWPDDAGTHSFDAVAVTGGGGEVHEWDEEAFEAVIGESLRPIVAWGSADRPRLGQIIVGTALLSRSYPGHGPLHPVALVTPNQATPNTAPAYFARGFEIVSVPEKVYR